MLTIDGSRGEGGGQILRSALALSVATGTPIIIENVRAGRKRPGLLRQHLTAVLAARAISGGEVSGAELGSPRVTLHPGPVRPGDYEFSVGTAGSACLVLQTVLPPLLTAPGPTKVSISGGTHNPFAPPFEFLERCFLPVIRRMGAKVDLALERPGFFPAGGGRIDAVVEPAEALRPIELHERGRIERRRATAIIAHLPRHVADRELAVVSKRLGFRLKETEIREAPESAGPGNALLIEVAGGDACEIVTAFGQRGKPAEKVAAAAVREMKRYLDSTAPVGERLADQLLLSLALAGGGGFTTLPLSSHFRTNAEVIGTFLPVRVATEETADGAVRVEIVPR